MFDIFSFTQELQTGRLGRRFWYFRTLDSTNRYLQHVPGARLSHGLVCLADDQSEGKGQYGRTWHSQPGENLTFTVVIKPRRNDGLQLFPLAAMLALKETLSTLISCEIKIKWPNDLLVAGEKIAGLLTECRYNGKMLDRMMLGLGVNVNQSDFPENYKQKATSLRRYHGGEAVDRALFLAELLNRLEPLLEQADDGDPELVRNINRSIQGYGEWVSLILNGSREQTPVKVLGINDLGYMMVLTANDDIKMFTHEQFRFEKPGS